MGRVNAAMSTDIRDYTRDVCALLDATCREIPAEQAAWRANCELAHELLLRWIDSTDARLIDNLAHSRVAVHDLLKSQERLIGVVGVVLEIVPTLKLADKDARVPELIRICTKEISNAVKVA